MDARKIGVLTWQITHAENIASPFTHFLQLDVLVTLEWAEAAAYDTRGLNFASYQRQMSVTTEKGLTARALTGP